MVVDIARADRATSRRKVAIARWPCYALATRARLHTARSALPQRIVSGLLDIVNVDAAIAPRVADPTALEAWYGHITHLAQDIGPRGSATPAEAQASEYVRATFAQAGLQPESEPFRSGVSAWWQFSLAMALVLAAVALYPLAGRPSAALATAIVALALASTFLEVHLRWSPLRLVLPRRDSRNVWAAVRPRGAAQRRVAVIGHVDSHRTPLLFR